MRTGITCLALLFAFVAWCQAGPPAPKPQPDPLLVPVLIALPKASHAQLEQVLAVLEKPAHAAADWRTDPADIAARVKAGWPAVGYTGPDPQWQPGSEPWIDHSNHAGLGSD